MAAVEQLAVLLDFLAELAVAAAVVVQLEN